MDLTPPSPKRAQATASLLVALLLSAASTCAQHVGRQQSCQVAQLQCHARSGCQMALKNFFIHCSSLIVGDDGQTSACPTDCKHALVSLLSTEDNTGHAFINCDCGREKVCVERKRRVNICQREVLDSMHVLRKGAAPVTCNLARWICEADTSCLAALRYYYDHCTRLFKGIRCSSRCKNSLRILSRQQHAQKLRHCLCDGSEDYDCSAVKTNTEEMCFQKHNKRKYGGSNSRSPEHSKKGRARRRLRRRKRRNQSRRRANRKRRRQRREERKKKKKQRMRKKAARGQ